MTAQPARRVGAADENATDSANNNRKRPETNTTKVEGEPSKKGPKHGGGINPKPEASLKKREDDAMLRVRQDIRQPVTSLWQTAAARASTAPTRTASHRGGMVDCTNTAARRDLSRRRPQSQSGVARAKRDDGRADANSGVVGECPHAGEQGAVSSADGEKIGVSRGRSSRESEQASTNTNFKTPGLVSVRGPGARVVDRAQQGRRTPIPLRSSHRVGPVGSLGGRLLAVGVGNNLAQTTKAGLL